MNKVLKNMIRKTIEREYYKTLEEFPANLKKDEELQEQHKFYSEKASELFKKLYDVLPEEQRKLLDEYDSANTVAFSMEAHVAFKEGLILGVTELNFLNEVGLEIAFI